MYILPRFLVVLSSFLALFLWREHPFSNPEPPCCLDQNFPLDSCPSPLLAMISMSLSSAFPIRWQGHCMQTQCPIHLYIPRKEHCAECQIVTDDCLHFQMRHSVLVFKSGCSSSRQGLHLTIFASQSLSCLAVSIPWQMIDQSAPNYLAFITWHRNSPEV